MELGMRKASLTPAQKFLLTVMQESPFSRIERLGVQTGQPVFGPETRVVQKIIPGGKNSARPEVNAGNFVLKTEHIDLFECLSRLGSGVVETIEIHEGLPVKVEIEVKITK